MLHQEAKRRLGQPKASQGRGVRVKPSANVQATQERRASACAVD